MYGFANQNVTKCIHNNNHQPYSNMHVKGLIESLVPFTFQQNQTVFESAQMYRTNV